jgi:hypothetical protein
MSNNDATYIGLLSLRDKLDLRQSELQTELKEVTRRLDSVSTTLSLLDAEPPRAESEAEAQDDLLPIRSGNSIDLTALRGMTQIQAVKRIAEHNGGLLHTAEAKVILLQAGLIKTPKNANNILFSVIQRSGQFVRVQPGTYRLASNKPDRPQ